MGEPASVRLAMGVLGAGGGAGLSAHAGSVVPGAGGPRVRASRRSTRDPPRDRGPRPWRRPGLLAEPSPCRRLPLRAGGRRAHDPAGLPVRTHGPGGAGTAPEPSRQGPTLSRGHARGAGGLFRGLSGKPLGLWPLLPPGPWACRAAQSCARLCLRPRMSQPIGANAVAAGDPQGSATHLRRGPVADLGRHHRLGPCPGAARGPGPARGVDLEGGDDHRLAL